MKLKISQGDVKTTIPIRFVDFLIGEILFVPADIFHLFFLLYTMIFNGFIEKLLSEISSFLSGMAFPNHPQGWGQISLVFYNKLSVSKASADMCTLLFKHIRPNVQK